MRVGRFSKLIVSLLVSVTLVAASGVAVAGAAVPASHPTSTSTSMPCASSTSVMSGPTRVGRMWGLVRPRVIATSSTAHCLSSGTSTTPAQRSPFSVASTATTLSYYGGSVMGATSGTPVTITPVFWTPAGYTFGAGYESLIEQYLTDVAHDSGSLTNVYSVLHQYTDGTNPINYNFVAGLPIIDTTNLQPNGCTPDAGASACITNSQIQYEVGNVMTANSLTSDVNHIVIMYLPPALESCSGTNNLANGGQCSVVGGLGKYCGYHSATTTSGPIYAVMPYAVTPSSGPTCSVNETPNANIAADSEISVTSHEISEAISDPYGNSWYSMSNGFEIGDNCNFIFDAPTGGTSGAYYNQTINGHHYYTQEEYSNADSNCIQGSDYMVSFDPNGATGSTTTQAVAYNHSAPLTANAFTRAGYTFAGWNTASDGSGTSYADGASYTFSASVTLYAQWTATTTYTVTFNANNGTGTMTNETGNANTSAPLTTNTFARTGYTFAGWNTVSTGGGTAYANGASYTFTASVTLYAQWTINSYAVVFNANGGTGSMGIEGGNYNTVAPLTTNTFTQAGYTFAGWNTVSTGGGTAYADGASYTFTASVTLYAQWTAITYTVNFNANNGTGTMTNETGNANTTAPLTAIGFTRTGYTFAGWNSASDGSGTAYANGANYTFTASVTLYAQWTINSYAVVFNANGGTGSMGIEGGNYNTTAPLTTNTFTRTGYTFAGWNSASDGSGTAYANGANYTFTTSVTLYAQWTAITFTVTFNANGGTGSIANETGNANTTAPLTANTFTRAGYTFAGWDTVASGTGGTSYADGANYTFTASVTLYAQWSAKATDTITFNPQGGGAVSSMSGLDGTTITLPSPPAYPGYTFNGWFAASSGGSALTSPYTLAGTTTLYAQWSAKATDTITFNPQGGGAVSSMSGLDGTTITLPSPPAYPGYTFNGWFAASSGGSALTSPYTLAGTTTLYAQWTINNYAVTFNANGGIGTMSIENGNYNTVAPLTFNAFTRAGYTFAGWNTVASGTGGTAYANGANYTFTTSVTLYAQWTINNYAVTFNANGGIGTMSIENGNYNTVAPLTSNAFTRVGYTFAGWNTVAGGTGGTAYANGANYTFTTSVTLYAQWTINNYAVTFNANGGIGTMSIENGNYNTVAPLTSNAFTRVGYTFAGWNTVAGGTGGTAYANGANYTFTTSVTLYAQWSAKATDTVTFNSQGGGAVSSMSGLDGTTITLPSAPANPGYIFNGWFATSAGGSALTSPYTLAGSVTLYAQWSVASSVAVTFNANGGVGAMASESQNVNVFAPLTANAFTRAGYTFGGWNTTANGTGVSYANGALFPFTVNVTLYAQWSAQTFTVSFDPNGGAGAMANEMGNANTSSLISANAFTRAGYTFTDWNTSANGTGTAYANVASYTFTMNVTLYAQWTSSGPVAQAPLVIVSLSGEAGRPLALVTSGGSGNGAVTFAVTDGTAQGCSISAGALRVASAGTCVVVATKAADATYLATSSADTTIQMKAPVASRPTVVRVTFAPRLNVLSASDVRALTEYVKRLQVGETVTITGVAWRNVALARARALAVERFVLARVHVRVVLREINGRANVATAVARP